MISLKSQLTLEFFLIRQHRLLFSNFTSFSSYLRGLGDCGEMRSLKHPSTTEFLLIWQRRLRVLKFSYFFFKEKLSGYLREKYQIEI
jgi:hypothetical protein